MEMIVSRHRCEFCRNKEMQTIQALGNDKYLVQCPKCGAIEETKDVMKVLKR